MTKRRLVICIGFVALVGIFWAVVAMLPTTPGVTKANFDRVQIGMTMKEVEGIFGESGTKIEGHDDYIPVSYLLWKKLDRDDDTEKVAVIGFLHQSVSYKAWDGPETFIDKLRRWFHL